MRPQRAPQYDSRSVRPLGLYGLLASALFLVSGCGASSQYADALSITLSPSTNVLIGPGPIQSCADAATYAVSIASGTPTTPTFSVTGPAVVFQDFKLEWKSSDTLYIQEIRATVSGSGLAVNPTVVTLSQDEIDDLLASASGAINLITSLPSSGGPAASADTTIDSQDAAARKGTLYGPCGLAFGGLTVQTNPATGTASTTSFSASIKIEVIGTAVDSSGNQRFVDYVLYSQGRYYGS